MYLCKFDEAGKRIATVLKGVHFKTKAEKQKYLDQGYIETSDDDYAFYVGNMGQGDNGTGYVRDPQTGKPVSAPPYIPSKEEKLAQLESEYTGEKSKLEGYFTTALLMDDTDTQTELKAELSELETWYAEEKAEIEG